MRNWLKHIFEGFVRWLGFFPVQEAKEDLPKVDSGSPDSEQHESIKAAYFADEPDQVELDVVYIVGENGNFWLATLLCPCGCGETIRLNLLKEARPCWTVKTDRNGSISLSPSVWRKAGCRSHFFIRKGFVEWVEEMRDEESLTRGAAR